MIRLLIVDDEPLVQAGIQSMINLDAPDIELIGTAANGAIAYDLIKEKQPNVVITDIKMPVMTGLELVKKCHEEKLELPLFIILTSFEEFSYAKEALSYGVLDYLVKLELTPDSLNSVLDKAREKLAAINPADAKSADTAPSSIAVIKEQFYTRLLANLFESKEQFSSQSMNLSIDFSYESFAAAYLEITSEKLSGMDIEKQLTLYTTSLQLAKDLISKYLPCHVLSLDMKHFAVIFFLQESDEATNRTLITKALQSMSEMLFNYYSVTLRTSVGSFVSDPFALSTSFQDAKQIFFGMDSEQALSLQFWDEDSKNTTLKNVFNMSLFREDIRKAYAEYDTDALYAIFTSVIELFENQNSHYVQALDAAGNILHLSLSLLDDGEQIVSDIFADTRGGYHGLYELGNVASIMEWLKTLRDGLCESFDSHNMDHKNRIVIQVKKYIADHIDEKLTLNKVANVFNFSSNYLSVLFSKHSDVGFNDYINQCKIESAKEMMKNGDLKIYEISDALGFESAFYFSRVFKKVTGMSPRDYMQTH